MQAAAALPRTDSERDAWVRATFFSQVEADYQPSLVAINHDRIRELEPPKAGLTPMSTDLAGTAPGERLEAAIAYILLVNSQNFQFWDIRDGEFVRYEYEGVVGARGMRIAFQKAWGDDKSSATFRRAYAEKGVTGLFGNISQPEARAAIFSEILTSRVLENLAGMLAKVAVHRGAFTLWTARCIADYLPESYADPYLKRAQLALAEIAGFCYENGMNVDCSELTLFADYQLPWVLRGLGVLEYAPALAAAVDSQQLIPKDSPEERAIRAATILAGERMAAAFRCTPAAVGNYLWTNRGAAGSAPFHLTVTTAY